MTKELGPALTAARKNSGVTQMTVVASTGLSQARLSRIENDRALPTEDEVTQLARLYRLDPDDTGRLVGLARSAAEGIQDSRLVVQRGNTLALQQRWRALEADAKVVRSFQPALVVGGLQTAAYAAVAMREPVDSPAVVDRVKRQERIQQSGRRLVAVHTEGALRRTIGSSAVMAEQLEHLVQLSSAPSVELGVIPDPAPADFIVGSGFHIYDDTTVAVGIEVASAVLVERDDIAHFRGLFDRLSRLAVFGDAARSELERARQWHAD